MLALQALAVLALAALALAVAPHPWASAWAVLALAGLVGALRGEGTRKILAFQLVFAAGVPLALELAFTDWGYVPATVTGTVTEGMGHPDPDLGWAPDPGRTFTVRKAFGDELVYETAYTIGPDGLRLDPAAPAPSRPRCALFFGGSYTFGEGVADAETLPAVYARFTGRPVHNFGYRAYGAEHMLAALRAGRLEQVCGHRPALAVYQWIPHHGARAAGRAPWAGGPPRFVPEGPGGLRRLGLAPLAEDSWPARWRELLGRSRVYARWRNQRQGLRAGDVDLLLRIVRASKQELTRRVPDLRVHALLWDLWVDAALMAPWVAGLQEAGVRVHLVSELLPDYTRDPGKYGMHRWERHPGPRAYARLGRALAARDPGGPGL